jgi:hypothetical protein
MRMRPGVIRHFVPVIMHSPHKVRPALDVLADNEEMLL